MKKIDFATLLDHPSMLFAILLALLFITFVPPRLEVRKWRKQKSKMEKWIAEKPVDDQVSLSDNCMLCGETRKLRTAIEVLPECMEATWLFAKKTGQVTYLEFRCAKCWREISRRKETAST